MYLRFKSFPVYLFSPVLNFLFFTFILWYTCSCFLAFIYSKYVYICVCIYSFYIYLFCCLFCTWDCPLMKLNFFCLSLVSIAILEILLVMTKSQNSIWWIVSYKYDIFWFSFFPKNTLLRMLSIVVTFHFIDCCKNFLKKDNWIQKIFFRKL